MTKDTGRVEEVLNVSNFGKVENADHGIGREGRVESEDATELLRFERGESLHIQLEEDLPLTVTLFEPAGAMV